MFLKQAITALFCLLASSALAEEQYGVAPAAGQKIFEHGVCRFVTNNNNARVMIPTRTKEEWGVGVASFLATPRPGTAVRACTPPETIEVTEATITNYISLAMSDDGEIIHGLTLDGLVDTSLDGGKTWTRRDLVTFVPPAWKTQTYFMQGGSLPIDQLNTSIFTSASGKDIVTRGRYMRHVNNNITAMASPVMVSHDYGQTWSVPTIGALNGLRENFNSAYTEPWATLSISGNGQSIISSTRYYNAGYSNSPNLLISKNGGSSWNILDVAWWTGGKANTFHSNIAQSFDGSTVVVTYSDGQTWGCTPNHFAQLSKDGGNNWNRISLPRPAPYNGGVAVADTVWVSEDGTKITIYGYNKDSCSTNGPANYMEWKSTDGGASFTFNVISKEQMKSSMDGKFSRDGTAFIKASRSSEQSIMSGYTEFSYHLALNNGALNKVVADPGNGSGDVGSFGVAINRDGSRYAFISSPSWAPMYYPPANPDTTTRIYIGGTK